MLRKIEGAFMAIIVMAGMVTQAAPAEASTKPQLANNCHHVAVRPNSIYSCLQSDDILVNNIKCQSWRGQDCSRSRGLALQHLEAELRCRYY